MGSFQRAGSFKDREKFVGGLKTKVGALREKSLKGMKEEWKKEGENDIGHLSGFGVQIHFEVRKADWDCKADVPMWLPIPQSKVEGMFDDILKGLKDL